MQLKHSHVQFFTLAIVDTEITETVGDELFFFFQQKIIPSAAWIDELNFLKCVFKAYLSKVFRHHQGNDQVATCWKYLNYHPEHIWISKIYAGIHWSLILTQFIRVQVPESDWKYSIRKASEACEEE